MNGVAAFVGGLILGFTGGYIIAEKCTDDEKGMYNYAEYTENIQSYSSEGRQEVICEVSCEPEPLPNTEDVSSEGDERPYLIPADMYEEMFPEADVGEFYFSQDDLVMMDDNWDVVDCEEIFGPGITQKLAQIPLDNDESITVYFRDEEIDAVYAVHVTVDSHA